jgi:hypothetical protein
MLTCSLCGQEIKDLQEDHTHMPDFALNVWNCQASLVWNKTKGNQTITESLPFNLPDRWVNFVLETCGGAINMSGQYRLPGIIWEWVLAKLRGDEKGAIFIEKKIDELIDKHGF